MTLWNSINHFLDRHWMIASKVIIGGNVVLVIMVILDVASPIMIAPFFVGLGSGLSITFVAGTNLLNRIDELAVQTATVDVARGVVNCEPRGRFNGFFEIIFGIQSFRTAYGRSYIHTAMDNQLLPWGKRNPSAASILKVVKNRAA